MGYNNKEKHGKKNESGFVNQFEGMGFKNEFDDLYDWKFDFSSPIQAKLEISSPGDIHEQQADDIARKVVNGEHAGMEVSSSANTVMTKGEGNGLHLDEEFENKLSSSRGRGELLDDSTRSEMEDHMASDLGDVRIHTDSEAHEMSESINAKAFTHGQDIYFKDGEYDPDTDEGKELLAHELVHTQQQQGNVERMIQRVPEDVVDDIYGIPRPPYGLSQLIRADMGGTVFHYKRSYNSDEPDMISAMEFAFLLQSHGFKNTEHIYKEKNSRIKYTVYSSNNPDLDEVTVTAEKNLRYKQVLKFFEEGDYTDEMLVLLLRKFSKEEQDMFLNNKDAISEMIDELSGAEVASAVAFWSCDYKTKIEWIKKAGGDIYYKNIRELLRYTSDESLKIDELFRDKMNYELVKIDLNSIDSYSEAQKFISNTLMPWHYFVSEAPVDYLSNNFDITADEFFSLKGNSNDVALYKAYVEYTHAGSVSDSDRNALRQNYDDQLKKAGYSNAGEYEQKIMHPGFGINHPLLDVFEKVALKNAFRLLDTSELTLQAETDNIIQGEEDAINETLQKEKDYYDKLYRKLDDDMIIAGTSSASDKMYFERSARIDKEMRERLGPIHPILYDESLNLHELFQNCTGDKPNGKLRTYLLEKIGEKQKNIIEVRESLTRHPERVWKYENLIQYTKQAVGLDSTSPVAYLVDKKFSEGADRDQQLQLGLALFAIALGVLSLGAGVLAMAGLEGAMLASGYLTAASLAVNTSMVFQTNRMMDEMNAASNILIGPKGAQLSQTEISKLQLILGMVGIVADLAVVFSFFKISSEIGGTSTGITLSKNASSEVKMLADSPIGAFASKLFNAGKIQNIEEFLAGIAVYRKNLNAQLEFLQPSIKNEDVSSIAIALGKINEELSVNAPLNAAFKERFLAILASVKAEGIQLDFIRVVGAEYSAEMQTLAKLVPMTREQATNLIRASDNPQRLLLNLGKVSKTSSPEVAHFILTFIVRSSPSKIAENEPFLSLLARIQDENILPEECFSVLVDKINKKGTQQGFGNQISVEAVQWIIDVVPKLSEEARNRVFSRLRYTGKNKKGEFLTGMHFEGFVSNAMNKSGIKGKLPANDSEMAQLENFLLKDNMKLPLSERFPYHSPATPLWEKNLDILADTEARLADEIRQYHTALESSQKPPTSTISESKLAQLDELMRTSPVKATMLEDARSSLVAKVNQVLGSNIKSSAEFRQLVITIKQNGSRGRINEDMLLELIPKILKTGAIDGKKLTLYLGKNNTDRIIGDHYWTSTRRLLEFKNGSDALKDLQFDKYAYVIANPGKFEAQFIQLGLMNKGDDPASVIQQLQYWVTPGPRDYLLKEQTGNSPDFVDPVAEAANKFYSEKVKLNYKIRDFLEIYYMDTYGNVWVRNNKGVTLLFKF